MNVKKNHRDNLAAAYQTERFSYSIHNDMHQLPKIPNFFPKSSEVDVALTRTARAILVATILWAFVELPFELLDAQTSTAAALLLIETLLAALVALLTLQGVDWARFVFVILCGTSIAVIVLSFATDIRFYPIWFTLSLIELIIKAGSLVMLWGSGSRST